MFGIDIDFFGENGVNLWGFAIGAIKGKGFGKVFSFSYNFDIKAFLIKLMLGNSALYFIQQPLINIDKLGITGFVFPCPE